MIRSRRMRWAGHLKFMKTEEFQALNVVWLLFVLFCVMFVCKCVLPPGDNPIAVNKYHHHHIILGLVWRSKGNRTLGRLRSRWEYNIKRGMGWIDLVQVRTDGKRV
jgi:hypothetical protein